MARTPQEIFEHHAGALISGDLDGIVEDYSDDAIFITPDGTKRGKAGVREGFTKLLADLPSAEWGVKPIFEDNVLFLEGHADSATTRADDGVDTFLFDDDSIRVQTVRYTLQHKS